MTSSTERVLEALRSRGERLTIQRRMVVEALCDNTDHLTIGDVVSDLQARGVELNEPTVYRILQWLKDLGFVSQTDLGGHGIVYQVINEPRHHHLVCLNCNRVIDVSDQLMDDLRARLRETYGFEPRIDHMAFFGLCRDCQRELETHIED